MLLNSSSTISDVIAAYAANCLYDSDNSTSEAIAFIQACRILLLRMPEMSSQDRAMIKLNPAEIRKELDQARMFLALNPNSAGGGTGRYMATDAFRGYSQQGINTNPDPGGSP